MPDQGRVEREERAGALVLRPLDVERTGRLSALQACVRAVENATYRIVVVDLSDVPDLSSADLGVLIGLGQIVGARSGRLRLASLSPAARRGIEAACLVSMLPIFPGVREALEAP